MTGSYLAAHSLSTERKSDIVTDSRRVRAPSTDGSETSLCFPFDLLLTGEGEGRESSWDGEASMSFENLVNAKLGGTVNYNLKHVN